MVKPLVVSLLILLISGCAIFNNERGTGDPQGMHETPLTGNSLNIVNATIKDKSWQGLSEEIDDRAEELARNSGYGYYVVTPKVRDIKIIFNDFPGIKQRIFTDGLSGGYYELGRPTYVFEHKLRALSAQVDFHHQAVDGSKKVFGQ